ncbi:MAG TPA: mitofilin family membrane protein [Acetobacteraceae bacterium]|nr:mitofilin family membrane protein [Acetobacteraceae bacterium]
MTDPDATQDPPQTTAPEPKALPPPEITAEPAPRRRRNWLPVLCALGFLLLAGAIAWLWRHPPRPPGESARITALTTQIGALRQQVASLQARKPADVQALSARLSALEQRKLPPDVPTRADLATLSARMDAIAARQDAQGTQVQGLAGQIKALSAQVDQVAQSAGALPALAARAAQLARIQAAEVALAAGQPIGAIPDAPAALARFATTAPPTEAGLRLAFPAAAAAALKASRPAASGQGMWQHIWSRAQSLITVRRGDAVLLGDPAAGILAQAQKALDAGDLAGAVAALGRLQGPAKQAMAGWAGQAQALLDARAALAALAGKA